MRFYVRTIDWIVVTDAKDSLLSELVSVTNPTDDHLYWIVWSIAVLDPFRPSLDYRDDEINDTLRESYTGRSERQINQKLRTTFVFDECALGPLSGHGREMLVNERIGVRRVLTVKAPRGHAHLQ